MAPRRNRSLLLLVPALAVLVLIAVEATRLAGLGAAEVAVLRVKAGLGQALPALRLRASALLGNVEALRAEGLSALAGHSPAAAATAIDRLTQAAERGDARSALILGKLYFLGKPGLTPDYRRARAWLEQAAPARPAAYYYLALIEKNGLAGPPEPGKAGVALKRAADAGISQAMFLLANDYLDGAGAVLDEAAALRLMRQAAEQDHPGAQQFLAQAYARGEMGLPRDDREAALLFTLAGEAARDGKAYP